MPTPIGPQTSWICPSLNPTQTGSPDELISGIAIDSTVGTNVWTPDTDNGGTYSVTGAKDERSLVSMLGLSSPADVVDRYGYGFWMKTPSGTFGGTTGVRFDEDAFKATTNNDLMVNFDMRKYNSGGWIQSQIVVTVDTFAGGGLIRSGLKMSGAPANGWTDAGWQAAMEGWNHWYVECDFPRGYPTAVSDDGDLLGPSPYHRVYFNGQLIDTGGTGNGTCAISEGLLQLSNDSGCFFFGSAPSSATFDAADKAYMTGDVVWDDLRMFTNTLPTSSELLDIAASRGAEGVAPSVPTPLPAQASWICPSLNTTQTGSPDELISGVPIVTASSQTPIWTPETSLGGSYGVRADIAERQLYEMLGSPAAATERWASGGWIRPEANAVDSSSNRELYAAKANWFGGGDEEGNTFQFQKVTLNSVDYGKIKFGLTSITSNGAVGILTNLTLNWQGTWADWQAEWNEQWHHIWIELDFSRGTQGGTNYNPLSATPYYKVYLDGIAMDLGYTGSDYTLSSTGGVGGGSPASYAYTTASTGRINGGSGGQIYDDWRFFNDTLPTEAELTSLAGARAYQPSAPSTGPTGIGGETMWVCPTLSSTNGLDDLTGNGNSDPATLGDNIGIVVDTGESGSHALRWGAELIRL